MLLIIVLLFNYLININQIECFNNSILKKLLICKHYKTNENLLLEDNVIICGNAPDIIQKDNTNIDNYSTVVRVNCYKILDEKYYLKAGKKCDLFIWAGCRGIDKILPILKKYKNSNHMFITTNSLDLKTKDKYKVKNCIDLYKKYTDNIYLPMNSLYYTNNLYDCSTDGNNCLKKVNITHNKLKVIGYENKIAKLTSGIRSILWFISSNFNDITIKGYTLNNKNMFIKNNKLYRKSVHNNNKIGRPGCCHDLFEEVNILNDLINNDVIKYLK